MAGGLTPESFGGFEDIGNRPDANPHDLDFQALFKAVGGTFTEFRALDRDLIQSIWEAMIRIFDNEHRQAVQVNASKNVNTVPTFVRKDWLLGDFDFEYLGVPHAHFLQALEVTAPMPVDLNGKYYLDLDTFVKEGEWQMWVDGKEVSSAFDPIAITNTPAAGSPVLAASRLWFSSPLPIGTVVVVHGLREQDILTFVGDGATSSFSFGGTIDVNNATVFANDIEMGEGKVKFVGSQVILNGGAQAGDTLRVTDSIDSKGFEVTEATQVFDVGFPVNATTTRVFYNGLELQKGFSLTETGISFLEAPRPSTTIKVAANFIRLHEHVEYSETFLAATDTILIPTELPELLLNNNNPKLVFVDGVLVAPDALVYTDSRTIVLPAVAPIGTRIDVWWTAAATVVSHLHERTDLQLTAPASFVLLATEFDQQRPLLLTVDGIMQTRGVDYNIVGSGRALSFVSQLPAGAIIRGLAQRHSFNWKATDKEPDSIFLRRIVAIESIQDGIDYPTTVLTPLVGQAGDFEIKDGCLFLSVKLQPMWLKNVDVDEDTAFNNFGALLRQKGVSGPAYTKIVQALFAAYTAGSQVYTLENYSRVILNIPFTIEAGKVLHVNEQSDGGFAIIILNDADGEEVVYALPPPLQPAVVPDEQVRRFQSLGLGVTVHDSVTTPNWQTIFPFLTFIGDQFSPTFEAGRVLDRGVPATVSGTGATYDIAAHSVTDSMLAVETADGVRRGDRIQFTIAGTTFVDRIDSIDSVTGTIQLITKSPGVPETLYVPVASAAVATYTISFRRFPQYDEQFFMDSPERDYTEFMDRQLYELLKQFLFLVEISATLLTDPEAMTTLTDFLDTGKRAVTNYVMFAYFGLDDLTSVPGRKGVHELVNLDVTDDATITTTAAYLTIGQNYIGVNYIAASPVP